MRERVKYYYYFFHCPYNYYNHIFYIWIWLLYLFSTFHSFDRIRKKTRAIEKKRTCSSSGTTGGIRNSSHCPCVQTNSNRTNIRSKSGGWNGNGSEIIESNSSQWYRRYNLKPKPEDKIFTQTYRLHIFKYKYERIEKQESKLIEKNRNGHLNDGTNDLSKIRRDYVNNDGQLYQSIQKPPVYPRLHSLHWPFLDHLRLPKDEKVFK